MCTQDLQGSAEERPDGFLPSSPVRMVPADAATRTDVRMVEVKEGDDAVRNAASD